MCGRTGLLVAEIWPHAQLFIFILEARMNIDVHVPTTVVSDPEDHET